MIEDGKNNPYFTQRMMDFKLVFTTQKVLGLLQVTASKQHFNT